MVPKDYSEIMDMDIRMRLYVDSKDLFRSLSTKRHPIDQSIRGDVGCIQFEFDTGSVEKISSVPAKVNLADR